MADRKPAPDRKTELEVESASADIGKVVQRYEKARSAIEQSAQLLRQASRDLDILERNSSRVSVFRDSGILSLLRLRQAARAASAAHENLSAHLRIVDPRRARDESVERITAEIKARSKAFE